jgi:hypothetical protein
VTCPTQTAQGLLAPVVLSVSLFGLYLLIKFTDLDLQARRERNVPARPWSARSPPGVKPATPWQLPLMGTRLLASGLRLRHGVVPPRCSAPHGRPRARQAALGPHRLATLLVHLKPSSPPTTITTPAQAFFTCYFFLLAGVAVNGAANPLLRRAGAALGQPAWEVVVPGEGWGLRPSALSHALLFNAKAGCLH